MSEAHSFGSWLKQRRRSLDLTQEELAQRATCSLSTLRKIEADTLAPSKELAHLLGVALVVPAAEYEAFIVFARGGKGAVTVPAQPAPPQVAPAGAKPQNAGYYLPTPLTGLVGRERELQSGCALLRREHVRLLTLVGPPGAGKTRLSLALAKALQPDFVDGVCFVPLEPIREAALVLPAIAQAVHVRESADLSLALALQEALSQQQLLLVLDNFEQVVEAAPQLGDLLLGAPGLKIIVSSREALKLYGEYEFPVLPLALPDLHQLPAAALLDMYPAVELFVQRARAVRPNFAIDANNAATIAQICAWLDGLPLAIELAAAQIKWQTPANLLEQLRKQLLTLTGGPRDLTPRQQTLRGALDWSYNLLTPVEQHLLVACGVINGSGTTSLIAALTDLEPTFCDGLLRGLTEKSLLQCSADEQGELRYTLLQMVREYAQAKQQELALQASLQARHAAFYSRLVAESLPALRTAAAESALNRLAQEHNNLRSALTWYLQTDPLSGVRLATRLGNSLWGIRGYFREGRHWLEKLLAVIPTLSDKEPDNEPMLVDLAAAHLTAARITLGQGDLPAAARFAHSSEQLALLLEDDPSVRAALRCRAAVALHQSDYAQATQLYQQALALCNRATDPQEAVTILNGLGLVVKDQGDFARALVLHEESYALATQSGDRIGQARARTYASIAAYWQGDYSRAIALAQAAMHLQQGIGDVISLSYSRETLGMALVKIGRFAEGAQVLEESLRAFTEQDDRSGIALLLVDLGQVAYAQQEYGRAFAYQRDALQIAYTIGDRRRCAFALEGMALARTRLSTAHESQAAAVRLLAAAATLRTAIGAPLPANEQAAYTECLALVAANLPPALYHDAWHQGATLGLGELVQACYE